MIIIDGSSILYRSYYALPDLQNENGESTGAIVGFMNELLLEKTEHPNEKIVIVMDRGGGSKRKEKFAEYKNNRPQIPNDLKRQAGIIKELVNALGYDIAYAQDGSEGDDAIGTLTNISTEKILIVSVDTDMLQLLSKTVKVELLSKGKREIYDEMRFEQEYDILAAQFADYKALRGDTSDNIPGVKGIGAVTARRLINTHKTLDNIYQNIGLIKPARIREILKAGKEIA
ncbi:MAG: 5'-3' exonuclease, partial [Selenomonadaceae bacterium]|nr:5'-3' exonuclease [Selenomonadaceae bacterium]